MEGAGTTTIPPAPVQSAHSWRKILTLLGGQGISLTGDYVLLIALSWTAVQLGGEREVTTLMLASSIPRALMLIFGGAVADTLGPRFVLLRTTAARAVLQGGGALVVLSLHQFWPLFVVAFLEGALLGLGSPSTGSIMPELVEGDQLDRANSLYATVLRVAPIIGTPAGAWLIAVGQVWQAMLVVSVTSLVAFSGLFYVTKGMRRPPPVSGASLVRRSMDGLSLLAGHARLRWFFISALVLDMAFGWPIEVALPLLVKQRGWHVEVIGIVIAAFSAGALSTGAIGAFLAHRLSFNVRLVVTGAGLAAGILLMALIPSAAGLAAAGAAVGLMSGLNGPATVTVYQRSAPKNKMGAAMSMLTLAGIGTVPFSIAVFGGLAALIGLQATWVVCGALAFSAPIAAAIGLRCPVSLDEALEKPKAEKPKAEKPKTEGADEGAAVIHAAKSA
jgi:MFS transporter, DHA3 family, macrolide efflux protein